MPIGDNPVPVSHEERECWQEAILRIQTGWRCPRAYSPLGGSGWRPREGGDNIPETGGITIGTRDPGGGGTSSGSDTRNRELTDEEKDLMEKTKWYCDEYPGIATGSATHGDDKCCLDEKQKEQLIKDLVALLNGPVVSSNPALRDCMLEQWTNRMIGCRESLGNSGNPRIKSESWLRSNDQALLKEVGGPVVAGNIIAVEPDFTSTDPKDSWETEQTKRFMDWIAEPQVGGDGDVFDASRSISFYPEQVGQMTDLAGMMLSLCSTFVTRKGTELDQRIRRNIALREAALLIGAKNVLSEYFDCFYWTQELEKLLNANAKQWPEVFSGMSIAEFYNYLCSGKHKSLPKKEDPFYFATRWQHLVVDPCNGHVMWRDTDYDGSSLATEDVHEVIKVGENCAFHNIARSRATPLEIRTGFEFVRDRRSGGI